VPLRRGAPVVGGSYSCLVNRTDRLYAIIEELRAVAPRPRSARWLAEHFEVSTRTVERDISALQQTGSPIWAEPGRAGGYCLDAARSLPPVNLTPDEAVALSIGLRMLEPTPFRAAARSASRKLVAAMQHDDAASARDIASRIHLLNEDLPLPAVPAHIASALSTGRVLRMAYADKAGVSTQRDIEPLGYVGSATGWYLIGWCRLRDAVRAFRVDRIVSVAVTAETAEPRSLTRADLDIKYGLLSHIDLG